MRNIAKLLLVNTHGRIQNIPCQQYASYLNNAVHSTGNNALKPQGNVAAKDRYNDIWILLINTFAEWPYQMLFVPLICRSSSKPPFGKPNKKDHRKRNRPEDDELDPMDPSSYSDAPRGGWYMASHLCSLCLQLRCSYFSFLQTRWNLCIINYVPLNQQCCTFFFFAGLLV